MSAPTSSGKSVHRLVADTDALVAYGSLNVFPDLASNVGITTTQKCYGELKDHTTLERGERYDPHAKARKEAAETVLSSIDDDSTVLNWAYCGESNIQTGEESILELLKQYANDVEGVLMMDDSDSDRADSGRELIANRLDDQALNKFNFFAVGFPIVVLFQQKTLSQKKACAAIDNISSSQGWKSDSALRRIWDDLSINCPQEPEFLD